MQSMWTAGRRQTAPARRAVTGVVAGSALLVLLSACGVTPGSHSTLTVPGTAGPAGLAAGSSPSPSPSDAATGSKNDETGDNDGTAGGPETPVAKGCSAGGTAVPKGAGTAKAGDLDGDGKSDTVWLGDQDGTRTLGVRTASGAGFTRTFTSAAPQAASAMAGRLGDGSSVILLDLGRSVQVFAVSKCQIVVTRNVQGDQYTFDRGFNGLGSGAGCPVIGSAGRRLAGYLAAKTGTTYTVTRTTINLSAGGAKATNGTKKVLGTDLEAGSSTVRIAQAVSCGSSPRALEPAS